MGGERWTSLWFERANTPSIILQRSLAVLAVNRAARDLLSSSDVLLLRSDMLACHRRDDQARLASFIDGLGEGETKSEFVGQVLLLGASLGEGGAVGVHIRVADPGASIECADLEDPFGITQAERNVLLLMVNGRSPVEIARQLNNSVLTIRTHTKRIYAKLGVQTKEQMFEKVIPYLYTSGRSW